MSDGSSRLAYTKALADEKATTVIAFFHRALVFFAAHGITRISRPVTDNGSNCTAKAFCPSSCAFIGRHQRTRTYTPRHNGKLQTGVQSGNSTQRQPFCAISSSAIVALTPD